MLSCLAETQGGRVPDPWLGKRCDRLGRGRWGSALPRVVAAIASGNGVAIARLVDGHGPGEDSVGQYSAAAVRFGGRGRGGLPGNKK